MVPSKPGKISSQLPICCVIASYLLIHFIPYNKAYNLLHVRPVAVIFSYSDLASVGLYAITVVMKLSALLLSDDNIRKSINMFD